MSKPADFDNDLPLTGQGNLPNVVASWFWFHSHSLRARASYMKLTHRHCYREIQESMTISLNLEHATDNLSVTQKLVTHLSETQCVRPAHQPECQPRRGLNLVSTQWRFMPITSPLSPSLMPPTYEGQTYDSAENWRHPKISLWISLKVLEAKWVEHQKKQEN